MSGKRTGHLLLFLICLLSLLRANPVLSAGSTDLLTAAQNNPLLMDIYRKDPAKAQAFWIEMKSMMRNQGVRETPPKPEDIPLVTRGVSPPSAPDGSSTEADHRLIKRNPALEQLYNKSPLATLRMLTRMKEAAELK